MKNRIRFAAILILAGLYARANDGAYRSNGGIIYPFNETKISIDKEILSFTVINKVAQVNIYFEFFNPEKTEQKTLVGFQAPLPSGDISNKLSARNLISNFRVLSNGNIIPFQIKAADCPDCELKDTSSLKSREDGGPSGVYVYLFEVTFKPGKNIICHSYDFPASGNVAFDEIYKYILTTGSKWAGGKIKEFTLQIDFGKNSYFYVNDVFPVDARWSVIGTGKTGPPVMRLSSWKHRMVRILSGKLEISADNFSPKENIDFGIPGPYSFSSNLSDKINILESYTGTMKFLSLDLNKQKGLTKEDLRILRNAVYATHGYQFKNQDLLDYFKRFEWYIPDPNITQDRISLNDQEKRFIDRIFQMSK